MAKDAAGRGRQPELGRRRGQGLRRVVGPLVPAEQPGAQGGGGDELTAMVLELGAVEDHQADQQPEGQAVAHLGRDDPARTVAAWQASRIEGSANAASPKP